MTYGEYKEQVKDLGFEEDYTMEEYDSIVRSSCNRAVQHLYDGTVLLLKQWYIKNLSTETEEWKPIRPEYITADTEDEHDLGLPDNLNNLVPLLASYFVWLDDDVVKATSYWNAYDEFRNDIILMCQSDVKAKITGGI